MGEITGKLVHVFTEETISEKMRKREFVINVPGKYSKDVCFQLLNDRTSLIDQFKVGDEINVSYELSSREYQGKYYTQANAWKIKAASESKPSNEPEQDNNFGLPF